MVERLGPALEQAEQALKPTERRPSRAVYPGADASLTEHLAKGGGVGPRGEFVAPGVTLSDFTGRASHYDAPRRGEGLAGAFTKALQESTGSAGGFLVETETADEIMRLIRARSVIMSMQPTVVSVKKELAVDSIATGATAYYVAENANITPSEPTFAENIVLRPKDLAALVPVSNRLLRDATEAPALDEVLRSDLAEVLALRADLAFLDGPTGGPGPVGIRFTPGLTAAPSLGANGAIPTYDDLKNVVAGLRNVNAPFKRPGWIFHPRTLSTIERLKLADGTYIGDSTDLLSFAASGGGGTLLDKDGPKAFLGDDEGRYAAFAGREVADVSADLLRRLGLEATIVVPVWPTWLAQRLAAGRTEPPPKFASGSYLLDDAEPEVVQEQVTGCLMELVRAVHAGAPEPVEAHG